MKKKMAECRVCSKSQGPLFLCSKCESVVYCSQECADVDWSRGKHGETCISSLLLGLDIEELDRASLYALMMKIEHLKDFVAFCKSHRNAARLCADKTIKRDYAQKIPEHRRIPEIIGLLELQSLNTRDLEFWLDIFSTSIENMNALVPWWFEDGLVPKNSWVALVYKTLFLKKSMEILNLIVFRAFGSTLSHEREIMEVLVFYSIMENSVEIYRFLMDTIKMSFYLYEELSMPIRLNVLFKAHEEIFRAVDSEHPGFFLPIGDFIAATVHTMLLRPTGDVNVRNFIYMMNTFYPDAKLVREDLLMSHRPFLARGVNVLKALHEAYPTTKFQEKGLLLVTRLFTQEVPAVYPDALPPIFTWDDYDEVIAYFLDNFIMDIVLTANKYLIQLCSGTVLLSKSFQVIMSRGPTPDMLTIAFEKLIMVTDEQSRKDPIRVEMIRKCVFLGAKIRPRFLGMLTFFSNQQIKQDIFDFYFQKRANWKIVVSGFTRILGTENFFDPADLPLFLPIIKHWSQDDLIDYLTYFCQRLAVLLRGRPRRPEEQPPRARLTWDDAVSRSFSPRDIAQLDFVLSHNPIQDWAYFRKMVLPEVARAYESFDPRPKWKKTLGINESQME